MKTILHVCAFVLFIVFMGTLLAPQDLGTAFNTFWHALTAPAESL